MALLLEAFIFLSGIVGLCWAYYNYSKLSDIELGGLEESESDLNRPLNSKNPSVV